MILLDYSPDLFQLGGEVTGKESSGVEKGTGVKKGKRRLILIHMLPSLSGLVEAGQLLCRVPANQQTRIMQHD